MHVGGCVWCVVCSVGVGRMIGMELRRGELEKKGEKNENEKRGGEGKDLRKRRSGERKERKKN